MYIIRKDYFNFWGGLSMNNIEAGMTVTKKLTVEEIRSFIIEEMRYGQSKKNIIMALIDMGVEEIEAKRMFELIKGQAISILGRDKLTLSATIRTSFGGIIAAILGGIVWGLIVIASNYEFGFVALGIGLLSGYSVLLLAREKKGITLKIIAVLSSILGILVGKYITYYHFVNEAIVKDYGTEAAAFFSIYSIETIELFIREISYMFSVIDIVFLLLAITAAWKIPKD